MTTFPPHLKNAAQPRVRILDIKDRIVIALHLGDFQVEIQLAVGAAREKDKPGGIFPDLVDDFAQGDEFACPGGHGHRFAAAQQIHQLHQDDLEVAHGSRPRASTPASMRGT